MPNLHNRSKSEKISKFIKNLVMYVKKPIIILIQFKFGHILASNRAVVAI